MFISYKSQTIGGDRIQYNKIIYQALNYINKNLEQNLNVDEIAEECAVSPSHFHRIFKTYVGISVMDYIRNRRLQNAISQITVGMNILDAAVMSGYETHTGFLKAFKKA